MIGYSVKQIEYDDTKPFILDIHYAKRMPSISYAYGLFCENKLVGIVSYGSPASPSLCKGVAGLENKSIVLELNRLVLKYNNKNEASYLVGNSLKLLPKPKIIVSYADTKQDHVGFIYQATNFLFTGTSKPRTDMAGKDGKHSRHNLGDRTKRVFRSSKHRYIYIIANKKDKKQLLKDLKYPLMGYPKNNAEIKMEGKYEKLI
mgnify:FL=1|tara:strand:+ start:44 stop:652 length:609 start_codon:yes stop_codon:yes gene_type:complete